MNKSQNQIQKNLDSTQFCVEVNIPGDLKGHLGQFAPFKEINIMIYLTKPCASSITVNLKHSHEPCETQFLIDRLMIMLYSDKHQL